MIITAFAFPSSIGCQAFESCTLNRRGGRRKSSRELYSIVTYTEKGPVGVQRAPHLRENRCSTHQQEYRGNGRHRPIRNFRHLLSSSPGLRGWRGSWGLWFVTAKQPQSHIKRLRVNPVIFNRRQTTPAAPQPGAVRRSRLASARPEILITSRRAIHEERNREDESRRRDDRESGICRENN